MATINVFKRKDLKTPTWQYDVRDERLKNGRKRQSGFKNKKDAQHAAYELVKQLDKGNDIKSHITFNQFFKTWIDANDKKSLSAGQYEWYERALRLFNEYFGEDKLLKDITKQQMQSFLTKYGKGRTTESVRKVHTCISPALKDAVYEGLIERDPTYKLKIKGTKAAKREEDKYTTIVQYLKMIEFFKSKYYKSYILLYLISLTGARFSEVNNMKWEDLNKGPGLIHLPGTKTDTAPRDVEMAEKDIEFIKQQLAKHPRRIDGHLFKISNKAASKPMKLSQDTIGIPEKDQVTIYGLRHTHCSYLLSKGIKIEYISKRLGHSSISTTLNIYSHLLDEYRKEQGEEVRKIYEAI